jgi:hypothetical protein
MPQKLSTTINKISMVPNSINSSIILSSLHALAKLTEQEELRASLGVPQIFLANIDRLNEDIPTNIIRYKSSGLQD